jgi:uncharacterized repeat protein (TIGR04138 family)
MLATITMSKSRNTQTNQTAMSDPRKALRDLLKRDRRYKLEAYAFIFEALNFAHDKLKLGTEFPPEEVEGGMPTAAADKPVAASKKRPSVKKRSPKDESQPERHLSGQELCEAIRLYAISQFGYMAKCVLNNWGMKSTGDFGNIVFNLIAIHHMRKTKHDQREHFDNVYDFDEAFVGNFKIEPGK